MSFDLLMRHETILARLKFISLKNADDYKDISVFKRKRDYLWCSLESTLAYNKAQNCCRNFWPFLFTPLQRHTFDVRKKKKPNFFSEIELCSKRRKRDSNPRRCDPQQFSRLPHSTTLPFLQVSYQVFPECGCKYRKLFLFNKAN
jgi:hypothetical protein